VRLPRNGETAHGVVLGEGKPENQNAAIIFCFGEVVQVGVLLLQGAPRWWRV
jgi:callose synthase